jgi:hypothetical protein
MMIVILQFVICAEIGWIIGMFFDSACKSANTTGRK